MNNTDNDDELMTLTEKIYSLIDDDDDFDEAIDIVIKSIGDSIRDNVPPGDSLTWYAPLFIKDDYNSLIALRFARHEKNSTTTFSTSSNILDSLQFPQKEKKKSNSL